jgi:hypothetical protein
LAEASVLLPVQDVCKGPLALLRVLRRVAKGNQADQLVALRRSHQAANFRSIRLLIPGDPARAQSVGAGSQEDILRGGAAVFEVMLRVPAQDEHAHQGVSATMSLSWAARNSASFVRIYRQNSPCTASQQPARWSSRRTRRRWPFLEGWLGSRTAFRILPS